MPNPRMTLADVCKDMRTRGMKMTNTTLAAAIEQGVFNFGKVISESETGRRNIIIMRKDYESWAKEYLGGN